MQMDPSNQPRPQRQPSLQHNPVFLKCVTKHTRFRPKVHSFAYNYLLVGIPLTFDGCIGRLFSFVNGATTAGIPWCFFSVNSRDYLGRGDAGFREKLGSYLKENSLVIEDYPLIYFVTAPRFCGYQFNPVSFWYLYDSDSTLKLIILEVNNTFDERHLYLLQATSFDATTIQVAAKQFHVSPFNDREGSYTVTAHDPLVTPKDNERVLRMNIVLSDAEDQKKLVALVHNIAPPVEMYKLVESYTKCLGFILGFGWSGLLTFPRILQQAYKLWVNCGLPVYFRPEIKTGSVARNSTALERRLQYYFELSLKDAIRSSNTPISLRYNSSQSPQHAGDVYISECIPRDRKAIPEVDLVVLGPQFYVVWATSKDMRQTLDLSMTSQSESSKLATSSDTELLRTLFDKDIRPSTGWRHSVGYRKAMSEAFLVEKAAFGNERLWSLYQIGFVGLMLWIGWRFIDISS